MTVELIAASLVFRERHNLVIIDFFCRDCGQLFCATGRYSYKSRTVIEIPRVTREDLICCPQCLEIQKEAGKTWPDTTPTG